MREKNNLSGARLCSASCRPETTRSGPRQLQRLIRQLALAFVVMSLVVVGAPTAQAQPGEDPDQVRSNAEIPAPGEVGLAHLFYDSIAHINDLADYPIDLHEYNNVEEGYVVAGMAFTTYQELLDDGWRGEFFPDDPDLSIDEGPAERQAVTTCLDYAGVFAGYSCVDDIYAALDDAASTHPNIAEIIDYGDSSCRTNSCLAIDPDLQPTQIDGYPLRALRLTNETNTAVSPIADRPALVVVAAVHARELTTVEQALHLIDTLIEGYGTDADLTAMLDWTAIYVIPVANPDGRRAIEVQTPGRSWQRKTLEDETVCSSNLNPDPNVGEIGGRFAQDGVDMNRNSSFEWGGAGSSNNPCALNYRGPGPASSPEVAALEAFVRSVIPDRRGEALTAAAPVDTEGMFISLHSYGDIVGYPWSHIEQPAPNAAGLQKLAETMASLTSSSPGAQPYTACQTPECLYLVSGSNEEWAYGELGVASFLFEVGASGDGFFVDYATAAGEHWDEVRDPLLYAGRVASMPYALVDGPDTSEILFKTSIDNLLTNGLATVTDTDLGGEAVVDAECYVDVPPHAGGTPIATPVFATDGNFDGIYNGATAEHVSCRVDFCVLGLDNGQHTLFMRGQDLNGNWGPVSAGFFTVTSSSSCLDPDVAAVEAAISLWDNRDVDAYRIDHRACLTYPPETCYEVSGTFVGGELIAAENLLDPSSDPYPPLTVDELLDEIQTTLLLEALPGVNFVSASYNEFGVPTMFEIEVVIFELLDFEFLEVEENTLHATVTCLGGNGRIDVNIVNDTDVAATYSIEIGSLEPRTTLVEPGTWWRSPVTGRPDGPLEVVVYRDGTDVFHETAVVACDGPSRVSDPEVQFFTWCVGGNGMIFAQMANGTAAARSYILEVGEIRRSTTAQPWGAAFRGISGRPNGFYHVEVFVGADRIADAVVEINC